MARSRSSTGEHRPRNAEVGGSSPPVSSKPKNGEAVAEFERAFAAYVGATYAIALCNGTATLHAALVAWQVQRDEPIAVPPLTMSSTAIAVVLAGGRPKFTDVDPTSWLMLGTRDVRAMPVSLYGMPYPGHRIEGAWINDAAQALCPHDPRASFTSYSFQASKLIALGEGGMLVTNDEELATRAREFSSLGYRMRADQPRIDPAVLKSPDFLRHHSLGVNYRMSDLVAAEGLRELERVEEIRANRSKAAKIYWDAIAHCLWLTPQDSLTGVHDYWAYALRVGLTPELVGLVMEKVERHGGERPYAAWALSYREPALRPWAPSPGTCPTAEDLQPRLIQFQTNDLVSAEKNAEALAKAIKEIG
jgi:perosamine synthetase